MERTCQFCNNKIPETRGNNAKYCSNNCNNKSYYCRHQDKIKERQRNYARRNYEKRKEKMIQYFKKWRKKKKKKFNNLVLKNYHQNKGQWICRDYTRKILNGKAGFKQRDLFPRICKQCKLIDNLQIHHEVYPNSVQGIINASKKGKIYYLCKQCHDKRRKKY